MLLPDLFCPACHTYLGPSAGACPACGALQPPGPAVLPPGEAAWRASLPGVPWGRPRIAGCLVFFAWGSHFSGGVIALDCRSGELRWTFATPAPLESGLAVANGRLFFAARGFLHSPAGLFCLDSASGEEAWRAPLGCGADAHGAPPLVADEARLYAAGSDGQIYCLDARTGGLLPGWPLQPERGRAWLHLTPARQLAVLTQGGRVYLLDAKCGGRAGLPVADLGGQVAGPPAWRAEELFCGLQTAPGEHCLAGVQLRKPRPRRLLASPQGFMAAPALAGERLYAGGQDHVLYALDLPGGRPAWQVEFPHGFTAAPCAEKGLVAAACRGGELRLLEAADGSEAWRYCFGPEPRAFPLAGAPRLHGGLLYAGAGEANRGAIAALPWHLGSFAWAADFLERAGKPAPAAACYALSATPGGPAARRQRQEKAVALWQRAGEWESAASYLQEIPGEAPQRVAAGFEAAGDALHAAHPERAAGLWQQAAGWFQEAGEKEAAARCQNKAGQAVHGPRLVIDEVVLPNQWEAGEEQSVTLALTNRGRAPAAGLRIRLGGSLAYPIWIEAQRLALAPGQDTEITAPLLPALADPAYLEVVAYWTTHRGECIIRCKSARDSGVNRPPNPEQIGQ